MTSTPPSMQHAVTVIGKGGNTGQMHAGAVQAWEILVPRQAHRPGSRQPPGCRSSKLLGPMVLLLLQQADLAPRL